MNTAETLFDVTAAVDAAAICDDSVAKLVGEGSERQFKYRGVVQEEKPLRDWLAEVLMNCLGYYTFCFGRLRIGVRVNASVEEAFTEGNILFQSLHLAPHRPTFNHLTANFADQDFDFVNNAIAVYDVDHAALIGAAAGAMFLKSSVNLAGTFSKSQAARLISIRLREELGGTTAAEWKAARTLSFRTTVLALNTQPGMVCSLTHSAFVGGSGKFRLLSWRLNRDFSLDIQGRTVTDSMYSLASGPKPADVVASPVPIEAVEPVPGDVGQIGGQAFSCAQVALESGDVALDITYSPPDSIGSFVGVYGIVEVPDGSGTLWFSADQAYNGDPDGIGVARYGSCRFVLPSRAAQEDWRIALASLARTFRSQYVPHDAVDATPTPNLVMAVAPANRPLQPSSVSCSEHAAERYLSTPDNLTHGWIYPVATLPANHRAKYVIWWLSRDNGSTWDWLGQSWTTETPRYDVLIPVAGGTWKVKASTGCDSGDNGPDVTTVSPAFSVGALAAPTACGVQNAAITLPVLRETNADGVQFWGLEAIAWTNPTAAADPNFFHSRLRVRIVDADGNAAPSEQGGDLATVDEDAVAGGTHVCTLVHGWEYNPEGSLYAYARFDVIVKNRAGAEVVQNCWPGGADHYDVNFGTLPEGTLKVSRLNSKDTTNFIANGDFERDLEEWDIYHAAVEIVTDASAASGSKYAKLTGPLAGIWAGRYQDHPAKEGETWVFRCTMKCPAKVPVAYPCYLWMYFYDSSGAVVDSTGQGLDSLNAASWYEFSHQFTCPAGTRYIRPLLLVEGDAAVDDVWYVDNARMNRIVKSADIKPASLEAAHFAATIEPVVLYSGKPVVFVGNTVQDTNEP